MSPNTQSVPVSETSSQAMEETDDDGKPEGTVVALLLTQQSKGATIHFVFKYIYTILRGSSRCNLGNM